MAIKTAEYRMSTTVDLRYERAVERTREELAKEGFGVLTEIDVKATLKKKLNEDFRPYIILGACTGSETLRPLAEDVKARLRRVLDAVVS